MDALEAMYPTMSEVQTPDGEGHSSSTQDRAPSSSNSGREAQGESWMGESHDEGRQSEGSRQNAEPTGPVQFGEYTMPAGVSFSESDVQDFESLVYRQGLDKRQAQDLLDYAGPKIKAQIEAPYRAWADLQRKWQGEVKADPELGGSHLAETRRDTQIALRPGSQFVTSSSEAAALAKALKDTGAGNNPAIVRFFARVGRALAQSGNSGGFAAAASRHERMLSRMYNKM